jgi:hypothetical protein
MTFTRGGTMFTPNNSIHELKAERTALLAQLNIETKTQAFCPGLDLDEYREMRRRVNRRIDEVDRALAKLELAKKAARASRGSDTLLRRVWASVF